MVRTPNPKPNAELQVRLGAAVKARRLGLDLTQEELAWRANMHRTYLADIERGVRNVTLRTLGSLATALDMPVSALLADSTSPRESATQAGAGTMNHAVPQRSEAERARREASRLRDAAASAPRAVRRSETNG